jgi:hypothetical protein
MVNAQHVDFSLGGDIFAGSSFLSVWVGVLKLLSAVILEVSHGTARTSTMASLGGCDAID